MAAREMLKHTFAFLNLLNNMEGSWNGWLKGNHPQFINLCAADLIITPAWDRAILTLTAGAVVRQ